jgi:hypothetical protein
MATTRSRKRAKTQNRPNHQEDQTEQPDQDPVNKLIAHLQKIGTEYFVDGDDAPCLRIKDDPLQQEYRLWEEDGEPTDRIRSWLRSQYRYLTQQQEHLRDADLKYALDYIAEDAYKEARTRTRTQVSKDGDYNFEAVLVLANSLGDPDANSKRPGNKLLDELVRDRDAGSKPKIAYDAKTKTLTVEIRTADLWRAIDHKQTEVQVTTADKATLYKALNFFSRRLTELREQFRKEGLELTVDHRADGSWVRIVRHDAVFQPHEDVVVTPDDKGSSSSAGSSGGNSANPNKLDDHDGTRFEPNTAN